jgi:hypothetical protein
MKKIANFVSTKSDISLDILAKIQKQFSCSICHEIVKDDVPHTTHCCHQFCCKECLSTWRAQRTTNGCPTCRVSNPTQVPCIFAGVNEFMRQLRRVPLILEILDKGENKNAASPTYIPDDTLNDIDRL